VSRNGATVKASAKHLAILALFYFAAGKLGLTLAIVRGTVELGHSLGLSVTAEGVEDKAAYTSLKLLGCNDAQGYYISRPLPADAFDAWLPTAEWKAKKTIKLGS